MKTCLIVDDSRVIRLVARKILQQMDFRTTDVGDGREALEACRQEMPDAILVDAAAPELGGIAFLKELRALPGGERPAVVLCAEELDEDLAEAARTAGANGTLNKPYDGDALRAAFVAAGVL